MAKQSTRPLGESIPPLRDHGVEHLMAAHKGGMALQGGLITQSGVAPFSVVLADHGLQDMADASYAVIVQIEGKTPTVDETSKTTTGFDILAGADTDVISVMIMGRMAEMSPDPSDL